MNEILEKVKEAKNLIKNADYILIGAGAGLSTSAGIEYTGKRFKDNFSEFIKKYNFTDMYTSGFYDFETEEEKWAYWAKHMYINNIGMTATKLYKDILELIKNKEYFVITTNVDDQFYKSGFNENKIFATQGSYRYIQCSQACHNKVYDATEIVKEMISKTKDCKIPTELVPICPVCGEVMETNLRKDSYFVQDDKWYEQSKIYDEFLTKVKNKKLLLIEFGVGFNTPGIIRFPFEQMVYQNDNWKLVRLNKDNCETILNIENRYVPIRNDINEILQYM